MFWANDTSASLKVAEPPTESDVASEAAASDATTCVSVAESEDEPPQAASSVAADKREAEINKRARIAETFVRGTAILLQVVVDRRRAPRPALGNHRHQVRHIVVACFNVFLPLPTLSVAPEIRCCTGTAADRGGCAISVGAQQPCEQRTCEWGCPNNASESSRSDIRKKRRSTDAHREGRHDGPVDRTSIASRREPQGCGDGYSRLGRRSGDPAMETRRHRRPHRQGNSALHRRTARTFGTGRIG